MKINKSLSIKNFILVLTLLPSLLIATVLTTYIVLSRQSDAQSELLLQINNAINYLSKSSELSLFSGDETTLKRLSSATISNTDMETVNFYDSNRRVIFTFGKEIEKYGVQLFNSVHSEETDSQWIFQTPVLNSEIDVNDFTDNDKTQRGTNEQRTYLGWVQIIADKTPLLAKKRNILITGVSVGSLIFTLLAFIALKLSHSITTPLDSLIKTVKELEAGDLNSRVSVSSHGEIKELVNGVNQLADKVKVSNKHFKTQVAKATQQLTSTLLELETRNKELEITGKELITASNAKDEFLASVSHELRTPLTSIMGYSSLLKKTELENEQLNQVDTINQASEILLQLIDNILDFSKLESESLDLESIPFNLNELLSEVSLLHMPAAKSKEIKLQITTDMNLPDEFMGDPSRLKQILNNIIHNAIKFTAQGVVRVSVLPTENEFGLLFHVRDTGIGIDTQSQSQLFKPFNQIDSSISRRFGGTGLGLVICEKLVSLFGGSISISSKEGEGTEVTFTILKILPLEEIDNSKTVLLEKNNTTINDESFSGKLIIVAEDNLFVQKLLKEIFEQKSADVITVENGLKAIEEINKRKPDLVVLDYHMPLLDGLNTCKKIRLNYSSQELPIILLTADVININKTKVNKNAINEVIYKPIQGNELLNCAENLILKNEKSQPIKVLDIISDDLLKEEINRLKSLISKTYIAKDYTNLKRYSHELCGIAGPSSKYKKIGELAIKIDEKVNDNKFENLDKLVDQLTKC